MDMAIQSEKKLLGGGLPPEHAHAAPVFKKENLIRNIKVEVGEINITTMEESDLAYIYSTWAIDEGWRPTQYSSEACFKADPQGYFLLFLNDKPIASLSAVCCPDAKIAFLGLYIVRKPYRGQGFGRILWDTIVAPLKEEGYMLGLGALPKDKDFYGKIGFTVVGTDQVWVCSDQISFTPNTADNIKQIEASDFEKLVHFDKELSGYDRKNFLYDWIFKPGTNAFMVVNDNEVLGYGVISDKISATPDENTGCRIGPLYSASSDVAKSLLEHLIASVSNRPISIDAPESNQACTQLLEALDFNKVCELVSMRDEVGSADNLEKVYGKLSLALHSV